MNAIIERDTLAKEALKDVLKYIRENFRIYVDSKDDAEDGFDIENWTSGGVDMVHYVDLRDVDGPRTDVFEILRKIEDIAENFDVDDEICTHMQDSRYKADFSFRRAVEDFEAWEQTLHDFADSLREVVEQYERMGLEPDDFEGTDFTINSVYAELCKSCEL